ncbi:MAG: hypothetical protein ND895_23785 [Pyrinomonadaceae bacterium]|nr:hypothetical protein [Pyrinomonadaceae bacterium]
MTKVATKRVFPIAFGVLLLFAHEGFGQRQMKPRPASDINQSNSHAHNGGRRLATGVRVVEPSPVQLNWLDGKAPAVNSGVSFGVPWPRGVVRKEQTFTLATGDGQALPLQTWPLAYWPDGSMKWIGFATVAGPQSASGTGGLKLSPGSGSATTGPIVQVRRSDTGYEIDTGRLKVRIVKFGAAVIESMIVDGREVARDGKLVCVLQEGPDGDHLNSPHKEKFISAVQKITVEQSGPVRAVVKFEGVHKGLQRGREWLPFVVRLYFYAGQETVRMVHSIIYDGDESRDFIRGVGVVFSLPMREQIQNRHVRFSGEGRGLWSEPVQPMIGRQGRFVANPTGGSDVYPDQIAGKRVPNKEQFDARGQTLLSDWVVWDDFKLTQPNADGFTVVKRTNAQSAWIPAGAGKRASGLVFAGDVSGGLAVSLKNFWQSYPAALEVQKASTGLAEMTVWLWSPDAPGMDMRHYDTKPHGLESVYEDVQQGFSTPHGVARTSELTLFPSNSVPSKEESSRMAQVGSQPPLLVSTPEYLHTARVLGIWSLQDRSTPFKKAIEDQLDAGIAYYQKAIDQHNWYGFWDYGDVMHSYDETRHVWRYDLGGMAWDNSELGTDMWLWYSFLRTGRADIFRMAEAMTRHTGEVDSYHLGKFAGLGSRHNVRHWGCGAKEARISQAAYRRYYYYLTTDERTGDVMREMVNADYKVGEVDPMRLASPITEEQKKYPARVRGGPDWLAFAGNWMTEWERTGDTKWRDKIYAGMDSITRMPYWFRSGKDLLFGYDPATGKLYTLTDEVGDYNLATIMGGGEVVFELNELVDHEGWQKAWLQYSKLTTAPKEVVTKDMVTGAEGSDAAYARPDRLAAYVYMKTKNPAFAEKALTALTRRRGNTAYATLRIEGPETLEPIDEAARVGTNGTAQSSLVAIQVLEMCADRLPKTMPPPSTVQNRPPGRPGDSGRPAGQPTPPRQ